MTDLVKSSAKKAKTHQRYYVEKNGKRIRVCGVTTIVGVLNKPALVRWANNLGLEGIEVGKYVDDLADAGTCAHRMVELDCLGVEHPIQHQDMDNFTGSQIKLATIGYNKFKIWKDRVGFVATHNEVQLVHNTLLYGGTLDIVGQTTKEVTLNNGETIFPGAKLLVDIKTSKGVYSDQKTQVAAYGLLAEDNNILYDKIIILRIGRNEEEGFEEIVLTQDEVSNHQKRFKLCKQIYEINKCCNKY